VLVAVFCCCNKLVKCVECGGYEDSVAFRWAEAGKGEASDGAGVPRELWCVCVCFDDSRFCCRSAWRIDWVMMVGMSESGMLVDHLVCLLARRSCPYRL